MSARRVLAWSARRGPLACLLIGLAGTAPARVRAGDAEWPCQQRLVPHLTGAAIWAGPSPSGDWRAEAGVASMVEAISPRKVPEAEGVEAIGRFAERLDRASRRRFLPLVLAGLVEEANRHRDALIAQILRFAHRQRELAEGVRGLEAELRALPVDAGAERTELTERRFFAAKAFSDAERTMRYVCEAPVRLERRLGAYARALATAMPPAD